MFHKGIKRRKNGEAESRGTGLRFSSCRITVWGNVRPSPCEKQRDLFYAVASFGPAMLGAHTVSSLPLRSSLFLSLLFLTFISKTRGLMLPPQFIDEKVETWRS